MKKVKHYLWLTAIVAVFTTQIISCKKEEPAPEVISGFSFAVDETNYKQVTFTNASQNYTSLEWDFGDGTAKSTDENPVHTYAEVGTYTVSLMATSGSSSDESSQEIVIADPNEMLTALAGDVSKTWKLLRDVSTGRYPLEVGPWDHSTIWWGVGLGNDELANRPCMLNDEWTFTRDGSMTFDAKGDYWGEGGIVADDLANDCQSTDDMRGPNDEDLSAWGGGNFTYVLTTGTDPTLEVDGLGAFVGFFKLGNLEEVKVPQSSVTYDIVKLSDGDVDTLIVEGQYKWDDTDGGYWRFVLVHYDNAADEPEIPSHNPEVAFTTSISNNVLTTTNTSMYATSYEWDFGDGATSTEAEPQHTYTDDGIYNVTLTATNTSGSTKGTPQLVIANANTPELTDALLQGNAWTVRVADLSVFVGPGLGDPSWWDVSEARLDGSSTGGDDWSCLADDEFTFSTGGVYGYDTKGTFRNDGYFAGLTSNGCYNDADLASVTNEAAMFKTFASHSYTLTPASGADNASITVTAGAADAKAFIGFYKAYNGGENSDQTKAANGGATSVTYEVLGYAKNSTTEYLFLSVDVSGTQDGSSAWSYVLVR